jgi:NDP-sugar pyrophosphorylase family protein
VVVEDGARLHNTIVWPNTRIGQNAVIDGPILGRNCHLGRNVSIVGPSVIGDKTTLTDYTHL